MISPSNPEPIGTQMNSSDAYKQMQAVFLEILSDCQRNIQCLIKDMESGSMQGGISLHECKNNGYKRSHEFLNMTDNLPTFQSHIEKMKKRISDNSRKILVTGDVNSGKSTFINALLREDLLPTDQQPCTQSFCEIELTDIASPLVGGAKPLFFGISKDFEGNEGKKVPLSLSELQQSIQEFTEFDSYKIILNPNAAISNSPLTLCLIDSPGLNSDLFKTVALHAMQEDIDIVLLILNAANHLTLSSRNFLELARREKLYIFLVVNKFDEIKKEEKCRANILNQISEVLPETFDKSAELIHFVSAKLYREYFAEPNTPESIEVMEISTSHDANYWRFTHLTESLKCFIYEKDFISKLLPAATLLRNIINDVLNMLRKNLEASEEDMKVCVAHFEIVKCEYDAAVSKDGLLQANIAAFLDKIKAYCQQQSQIINQDLLSSIETFNQNEGGIIFTHEIQFILAKRAAAVFSSAKNRIDNYIGVKIIEFENIARLYIPESADFWKNDHFFSFKETVLVDLQWPRPRFYELAKCLSLDWRQNWISVTALSSAIFAYQPLISSLNIVGAAFRMNRLMKFGIFCTFAACTMYGVVKIYEFVKDRALKCFKGYYLSYFSSPEWLFNLNFAIEKSLYEPFCKRSSHLVNEFVGFLRQQRELKANAELNKVRLEGLREYFSSKISAFSLLLDRIPQKPT